MLIPKFKKIVYSTNYLKHDNYLAELGLSMSRSVKSAKSSIKDIYGLMDSLNETVKNDIKSNLSSFEESLRTRLSNAENAEKQRHSTKILKWGTVKGISLNS